MFVVLFTPSCVVYLVLKSWIDNALVRSTSGRADCVSIFSRERIISKGSITFRDSGSFHFGFCDSTVLYGGHCEHLASESGETLNARGA